MRIVGIVISLALIVAVLIDAFETILQPRRVTHRFRYARLYYRSMWTIWRAAALRISPGRRREAFLGVFGPLSLLGLFATWVIGLILGFGLLHWSIASPLRVAGSPDLATYVYLSGTTFVTLGYGDVVPAAMLGRALAVIESALGFGFLAVIISYLPVLYEAYSRRELMISLMDARAGSPPSASQFLLRVARSGKIEAARSNLEEWERWSGDLLESHLSFPVLGYYRSQHDNQSWLATLATILDSCALLIVHTSARDSYQAQLTFAMARHAAVDLALVLKVRPKPPAQDRMPDPGLEQLSKMLRQAGFNLRDDVESTRSLAELRGMYEPFLNALARRFLFALPPIVIDDPVADNWQRSAWMQRTPGIGNLPAARDDHDHFD